MKNYAASFRWLVTLTILNTLIMCATGLPAVLTDPIPKSVLSMGFYLIAYVAQNFLLACVLGVLLLPIFLFVKSDRLKIAMSTVLVAGLLFLGFMNAKVYAFWRIFIDGTVLRLYIYGGTKVFEMSDAMVVWLWTAGFIFLIIGILVLFISKKMRNFFNLKLWFGAFAFTYVFAQCAFIFLATQSNMRLLQYSMKVPYFYDLSWARGLQESNVAVFAKDSPVTQLQKILSDNQRLHYPLHPLQYHLPQHPLNVLFIIVDTLRYDMINPTDMPNVYRYAQHADQFLDNLSGGDCTRPGIFSLFYSIPATYWDDVINHNQGSILIRAFQANHYQLGLFASAPLNSPPFDETVFTTVKNLKITTPGVTSLDRDKKITQEMQHFLNQEASNHKPFFGFMFYDAPHAYNAIAAQKPFQPTGFLNYFNISNNTPRTPIFNLYKNAVFADDQLIEKVFSTLKQDHLSKNTVVIITADHGQEFNDEHNDYWEHASGFSKYQMRTPMIIAWPNRAPKIYRDQTTHFDLAPTLLKRVLGVSNPTSDYSIGDDFFSKKQDKFVIAGNYAYYALLTNNKVMEFHNSGMYRFSNAQMQPESKEKITPSDLARLEKEMTMY